MKAVVRIGDMSAGHGASPPRPALTGSVKVFADTIPMHRLGDIWAPHPVNAHADPNTLITASDKLFADNIAVGQIGDLISCGDTAISGSSKVF